jgi:hypothetical protein
MVRYLHLLHERLGQHKNAWWHAHQPLTCFASAVYRVRCSPHVSLDNRPRACSCVAQDTTVYRPMLVSLPTLRCLQKERAQYFKVCSRAKIERMPSLSTVHEHTPIEASQTDRECYLVRHRRASMLGGRGERAGGVLSWPRQGAAVGVASITASRSRRLSHGAVCVGCAYWLPADGP